MFELSVKSSFSAAHRIKGYQGKCSKIHGHNWTVELKVRTDELNEIGMSVDFAMLKNILNDITEKLDHTDLNENQLLSGKNPTAENLAMIIYNLAKEKLGNIAEVVSVTVWESPNSAVTYRE